MTLTHHNTKRDAHHAPQNDRTEIRDTKTGGLKPPIFGNTGEASEKQKASLYGPPRHEKRPRTNHGPYGYPHTEQRTPASPLDGEAVFKPKRRGRECESLPRMWDTSSEYQVLRFSAPVREAVSPGQLRLMVHQVNRHSHKKACHKRGKHIPEELLHGYILLSENVPTSDNVRTSKPKSKPPNLSRNGGFLHD